MKLFEDLPSQNTPMTAEMLNQIKDNLVVVSPTEPTGDNREKVWMQKGKNLFNKDNFTMLWSYINASTGVIINYDNVTKIFILPIKSGQTYTISKVAGKHFRAGTTSSYPTNGTTVNNLNVNNNGTSITIPTGSDDKYLVCSYYQEGVDTLTATEVQETIQVEQNTTATSYEEYIEPKIYIKNDNDVYEEFISKEDMLENYSTEETKIGTWIDGKPLYRKVFKITGQQLNYNSMNVDEIVDIKVKSYCNDILFFTGRYNNSADMFTCYINHIQKIIAIDIGSEWLPNYTGSTIILEYTKTTD